MRKLVTLSGCELTFALHTAHLLPSYSCRLNNWKCSWQNTPLSPQLFSWSAYSGLWLPLSLLISWKQANQAQLSIFHCIFKDHVFSCSKEQRLAVLVQEDTVLEMQQFTQKTNVGFYAFTLSGLANKSYEIFILALFEGFSIMLLLAVYCISFCFCKPLIRGGFELPVSHVTAMGSGSSGS